MSFKSTVIRSKTFEECHSALSGKRVTKTKNDMY